MSFIESYLSNKSKTVDIDFFFYSSLCITLHPDIIRFFYFFYFLLLGTDLALIPRDNNGTGCATHLGYRNASRLCQACGDGFSLGPLSTCIECAEGNGGSTLSLVIIGPLAFTCFLAGLLALRKKSFNHFDPKHSRTSAHATMKRILLTHIQTSSLIMNLGVPWPRFLMDTLQYMSVSTSLSSSMNPTQCLLDTDYIDFYYMMLIFTAMLPIGIALIVGWYWYVIAPQSKVLSCGSKVKPGILCMIRSKKTKKNLSIDKKNKPIKLKTRYVLRNPKVEKLSYNIVHLF